jgi:hypothetical protein
MTAEEGTLKMQPSGRWAVCWPGRKPVEITSGELFRVEVAGELQLTRMKFRYRPRRGYYTVDGYPLRDGLRAAIGGNGSKAFAIIRCLSWSSCRCNLVAVHEHSHRRDPACG